MVSWQGCCVLSHVICLFSCLSLSIGSRDSTIWACRIRRLGSASRQILQQPRYVQKWRKISFQQHPFTIIVAAITIVFSRVLLLDNVIQPFCEDFYDSMFLNNYIFSGFHAPDGYPASLKKPRWVHQCVTDLLCGRIHSQVGSSALNETPERYIGDSS